LPIAGQRHRGAVRASDLQRPENSEAEHAASSRHPHGSLTAGRRQGCGSPAPDAVVDSRA
jgi:hypothetical protein